MPPEGIFYTPADLAVQSALERICDIRGVAGEGDEADRQQAAGAVSVGGNRRVAGFSHQGLLR